VVLENMNQVTKITKEMEALASFLANLSEMDLDVEFDSASEIPFDINNYFIRVPL